jgi:hypothetical protein
MDRFNNQQSAIRFDGINDYVQLTNNIGYFPITLSHWFKLDSLADRQMSMVRHRTFGYHTVIYPVEDDLHLIVDEWVSGGQQMYRYLAQEEQDREKWHHVAFTYNGNVFLVYYDGLLVHSSSEFGSNNPIIYGWHSTVFGRDGDVNNRYFLGCLDDILFFNRILTAEEILLLYQYRQ